MGNKPASKEKAVVVERRSLPESQQLTINENDMSMLPDGQNYVKGESGCGAQDGKI